MLLTDRLIQSGTTINDQKLHFKHLGLMARVALTSNSKWKLSLLIYIEIPNWKMTSNCSQSKRIVVVQANCYSNKRDCTNSANSWFTQKIGC